MNEKGRSMVEMLGVLAIIGVLSVSAMSGYSKAMMKYRLNKQAEQLNTVFNAVARYHGSFSKSTAQGLNLTPVFIKMGEIPTEMTRSNDDYLYDIFKTQLYIRTGFTPEPTILVELRPELIKHSNQNLEICRNILLVAKENSHNIYYLSSRNLPITVSNNLVGDATCTSTKKCLKDLSLNDIYTACTNFGDGTQANIIIVWKI